MATPPEYPKSGARASRVDAGSSMSAPKRRARIAAILARGVVRWRRDPTISANKSPESSQSSRNVLEFLGETRLSAVSGTHGLSPRATGDDA